MTSFLRRMDRRCEARRTDLRGSGGGQPRDRTSHGRGDLVQSSNGQRGRDPRAGDTPWRRNRYRVARPRAARPIAVSCYFGRFAGISCSSSRPSISVRPLSRSSVVPRTHSRCALEPGGLGGGRAVLEIPHIGGGPLLISQPRSTRGALCVTSLVWPENGINCQGAGKRQLLVNVYLTKLHGALICWGCIEPH